MLANKNQNIPHSLVVEVSLQLPLSSASSSTIIAVSCCISSRALALRAVFLSLICSGVSTAGRALGCGASFATTLAAAGGSFGAAFVAAGGSFGVDD